MSDEHDPASVDAPSPPDSPSESGVASKPASERPSKPAAPAAKPLADDVSNEPSSAWTPRKIIPKWQAFALATLSAVLCPLAFAGFDIWPLAFVCWVPLIVAMRGQSPRRAAMLGWWMGFGMTMIGFSWLVEMLKIFSGFPPMVCIFFTAVVCLQKGGRIALMGWFYARATQRRWPHAPAFLAAFAVTELIYPLLFTWYFAASVHQVPLLMQTASLGGPILVGVVLMAVNVAIAELVERPLFAQKPSRHTLIGAAATLVLSIGYGFFRLSSIDSTSAAAESATVGMVQGNQGLHNRSKATLVHKRRTAELKAKGVDLVVWSEAAIPRGFRLKDYKSRVPRLITGKLGVPTIMGGVLVERLDPPIEGRRRRLYNTALMADAKGTIVGRYDKQFLLMFGEYLPFGEQFPILYKWSPNSGQFSKGTSFEPLPFGEHRLATMICYEDISPSFVNKLMSKGNPDLLVNMTNDAWFGDTNEPWIHLALAKFRAVEQQRYLVRVTNSGVSAIVDPAGRVTVHGATFKEEALVGEVKFITNRTVYNRIGDAPWWLATVLLVAAAFIKRPGPPKLKPAT